MKIKFLPALIGLFLAASTFTSCLDNEVTEVTYSADSSIKAFSLGTLKVKVVGKDKEGNDSIYYNDMDMSVYPFTIDQISRTIENRDSLPIGTDTTKVITNITADTSYILYGKKTSKEGEPQDTLWTNTDSINFAFGPLEFKVMPYDGSKPRPYTVKINVHTQEPDSLVWHSVYNTHTFSTDLTEQKSVYKDNKIYTFGADKQGKVYAQYTAISYTGDYSGAAPGEWIEIELPQNTDPYSATLWNNEIYFLAQKNLYKLTSSHSYEPVSLTNAEEGIAVLIAEASDSKGQKFMYAKKANNVFTKILPDLSCTDDVSGTTALNLPDTQGMFSAVTIPTSHNNTLSRTIVMRSGDNAEAETGIVSVRLSTDQSWINYAQPDTLSCPNITDPTMIYYNKKLYAFGGASVASDGKHDAFGLLYSSMDNGLSWENIKLHETFAKPTEDDKTFAQRYTETQSYSCVVDEHHFIWIIWGDGSMSRGRINHLGFAPKW